MKITIDATEDELRVLKRKGLLAGATILSRVPKKRRKLSAANEELLITRLATLRAFRNRTGTFDVPRTGDDRELGDWFDKLKETYVKAPDGDRIGYLAEHAPDVLSYLQAWAQTKVTKPTVRNAPLWLNAAWVAEFMETHRAAPSQASLGPDEVGMAKWLSRWANNDALDRLVGKDPSAAVVIALDDVARRLRSRIGAEVEQARAEVLAWRGGTIYKHIATLCEADGAWMGRAESKALLMKAQRIGASFWPSLSQWRQEAAVWVPAEQPPRKQKGRAFTGLDDAACLRFDDKR